MSRTVSIAWFALVACTPVTPEETGETSDHDLGEFEAFVEATQMLVDGHTTAVEAATTLEEAHGAEAAYQAAWVPLRDELDELQERIEGCDMDDGMMDHMDATANAIGAMDAEMTAHASLHGGHATLTDCLADEPAHATAMTAAVDDCLEHHDAMHDGVFCMEMGHEEE